MADASKIFTFLNHFKHSKLNITKMDNQLEQTTVLSNFLRGLLNVAIVLFALKIVQILGKYLSCYFRTLLFSVK